MAFKLSPAHKEPPKGRLKKFVQKLIKPKGGQLTGGRSKGKQTMLSTTGETHETTSDPYFDESRKFKIFRDKKSIHPQSLTVEEERGQR